ncbi:MAG TPA: YfhO family protein [Bacteroidales bacterium]|nr:YfhO family protein [Bacteroidales bacterium]
MAFLYFRILHKAFLRYDGITEYVTVLTYWGTYLRNLVKSIFLSGKIVLPQWDFSIGYGADILTTMHWYVIGDPLNLLSIFFKPERTIVFYNFLVVFRMYLCGLTFLFYCRRRNFSSFSSLCGAFVYVFSGYALYCAVRHTFFIMPMVYLPLLYIGVDDVLEKRNPALFIISVFLACITNYYFFYVLSLLMFLYAVIRFFGERKKIAVADFLISGATILGFYLVGLAMAAAIFLPNVSGFLTSNRVNIKPIIPFLYRPVHYGKLLLSAVSPNVISSYTFLGFASLVMPAAIVCFFQKDAFSRQLKVLIGIYLVFLCFPFFGHVFNGFNYVTNRWSFAIAFVAGVVAAHIFPKLGNMTAKELRFSTLIPLILSVAVFIASVFSGEVRRQQRRQSRTTIY